MGKRCYVKRHPECHSRCPDCQGHQCAHGDTITVLDITQTQNKIRLAGIDAPEKKQTFGSVSKQRLADMVAGQSVAVDWIK
jgi:endonuclease YncB( thermonuclease family)